MGVVHGKERGFETDIGEREKLLQPGVQLSGIDFLEYQGLLRN